MSFSLQGSTRMIRSRRSCAQVTGDREGNGKVDGGRVKNLPFPPHINLSLSPPCWSLVSKSKMATAGNVFRPKNTPVYSRQSHDLWPPLTWPLPSSPLYYLVSPILLYFQTKTAGEGKMESFFARKTRRHVFVCQKYDANLLLYCYLRLAEKSSRLWLWY